MESRLWASCECILQADSSQHTGKALRHSSVHISAIVGFSVFDCLASHLVLVTSATKSQLVVLLKVVYGQFNGDFLAHLLNKAPFANGQHLDPRAFNLSLMLL